MRRIYSQARAHGLPEPQFQEVGMRMLIVLYLAAWVWINDVTAQVIDRVTNQIGRLLVIRKQ